MFYNMSQTPRSNDVTSVDFRLSFVHRHI